VESFLLNPTNMANFKYLYEERLPGAPPVNGRLNRGKIQTLPNKSENMKYVNNSIPLDDGSSKPFNQPETGADAQGAQPKPISEARRRANQNNSKKSTGPKTAQGKARSRRNALKHGILSQTILFRDGGAPIPDELHELRGHLRAEYGEGNPHTELLIETIVAEWYRQYVALQCELICYKNDALGHFSSLGSLPNLQRYRTASQRALFKALDQLGELPAAALPAKGSGDEPEVGLSAQGAEAVPQTQGETSGGGAVISEEGEPESGAGATGSEGEVAA
jgi:hypothetical protein